MTMEQNILQNETAVNGPSVLQAQTDSMQRAYDRPDWFALSTIVILGTPICIWLVRTMQRKLHHSLEIKAPLTLRMLWSQVPLAFQSTELENAFCKMRMRKCVIHCCCMLGIAWWVIIMDTTSVFMEVLYAPHRVRSCSTITDQEQCTKFINFDSLGTGWPCCWIDSLPKGGDALGATEIRRPTQCSGLELLTSLEDNLHVCAAENAMCNCTGFVQFGRGVRWSPLQQVSGWIPCDNSVFGDPAPGQEKVCRCFDERRVYEYDIIEEKLAQLTSSAGLNMCYHPSATSPFTKIHAACEEIALELFSIVFLPTILVMLYKYANRTVEYGETIFLTCACGLCTTFSCSEYLRLRGGLDNRGADSVLGFGVLMTFELVSLNMCRSVRCHKSWIIFIVTAISYLPKTYAAFTESRGVPTQNSWTIGRGVKVASELLLLLIGGVVSWLSSCQVEMGERRAYAELHQKMLALMHEETQSLALTMLTSAFCDIVVPVSSELQVLACNATMRGLFKEDMTGRSLLNFLREPDRILGRLSSILADDDSARTPIQLVPATFILPSGMAFDADLFVSRAPIKDSQRSTSRLILALRVTREYPLEQLELDTAQMPVVPSESGQAGEGEDEPYGDDCACADVQISSGLIINCSPAWNCIFGQLMTGQVLSRVIPNVDNELLAQHLQSSIDNNVEIPLVFGPLVDGGFFAAQLSAHRETSLGDSMMAHVVLRKVQPFKFTGFSVQRRRRQKRSVKRGLASRQLQSVSESQSSDSSFSQGTEKCHSSHSTDADESLSISSEEAGLGAREAPTEEECNWPSAGTKTDKKQCHSALLETVFADLKRSLEADSSRNSPRRELDGTQRDIAASDMNDADEFESPSPSLSGSALHQLCTKKKTVPEKARPMYRQHLEVLVATLPSRIPARKEACCSWHSCLQQLSYGLECMKNRSLECRHSWRPNRTWQCMICLALNTEEDTECDICKAEAITGDCLTSLHRTSL